MVNKIIYIIFKKYNSVFSLFNKMEKKFYSCFIRRFVAVLTLQSLPLCDQLAVASPSSTRAVTVSKLQKLSLEINMTV